MFSKVAGQLDRLIDAGMTQEQVHVFRSIFGNPDMELEHDGIVTFNGSVVAPTVQAGRWAVAQHNWDYNPLSSAAPSKGGKMAVVICREAADWQGNGTTGKSDITVYLPVTLGDDPNVVSGDVISFYEAKDGILVSPGNGDSRIGTIRQDINGDKGPKGWGVMDGAKNSKENGGSDLDLATNKRFLRQWTSASGNKAVGGADTDSVTVGSHSGGSVDSAVAIATHGSGTSGATSGHFPDHTHNVDNTSTVAAGSGTPQAVASLNHTGNMVSTPTPNTHTHTTPALSHTVTGSSALSHGAVTVDTVPLYIEVGFLERLNNSRTGLGL